MEQDLHLSFRGSLDSNAPPGMNQEFMESRPLNGEEMVYHLIQLAPGAYDVLRQGEIVASIVRHGPRSSIWSAELLDDLPPPERPAPFTEIEHRFRSFEDLCAWLGWHRSKQSGVRET